MEDTGDAAAADGDVAPRAVDGHVLVNRQLAGQQNGIVAVEGDRPARAQPGNGLAQAACAAVVGVGNGDGRGTGFRRGQDAVVDARVVDQAVEGIGRFYRTT